MNGQGKLLTHYLKNADKLIIPVYQRNYDWREEHCRNVLVSMGERTFLYKDVFVSATYNIAYMQMDIDVVWEDDSSQPDYRTLGLHGRYNSHFQEFQYDDGYLRWNDGTASISILF